MSPSLPAFSPTRVFSASAIRYADGTQPTCDAARCPEPAHCHPKPGTSSTCSRFLPRSGFVRWLSFVGKVARHGMDRATAPRSVRRGYRFRGSRCGSLHSSARDPRLFHRPLRDRGHRVSRKAKFAVCERYESGRGHSRPLPGPHRPRYVTPTHYTERSDTPTYFQA